MLLANLSFLAPRHNGQHHSNHKVKVKGKVRQMNRKPHDKNSRHGIGHFDKSFA